MISLPQLEPWQWAMVAFATVLIGASKTGIAGIGIISVALFALVWPARESVGIVLVVLICADCMAISSYRRSLARWDLLKQIYPWALLGVGLGYLAMGRVSDAEAKRLIGGILLLLVVLSLYRSLRNKPAGNGDTEAETRSPFWLTALAGLVAGITTMIANAAGPVIILYLLARRLDKVTFVATAAWFFFTVNLFKVPFGLGLGVVNPTSLVVAVSLLPCVFAGGVIGKWALPRIDQRAFEFTALALTFAAAVRLLL